VLLIKFGGLIRPHKSLDIRYLPHHLHIPVSHCHIRPVQTLFHHGFRLTKPQLSASSKLKSSKLMDCPFMFCERPDALPNDTTAMVVTRYTERIKQAARLTAAFFHKHCTERNALMGNERPP
ncbi:hypothetical protein, partial [Faecalibaculum rodentium]|uniref:hypothetical protein n=2 Tax=Faecalibaculum rodentium TaxID=1702221 RepID=UPI00248ABE42